MVLGLFMVFLPKAKLSLMLNRKYIKAYYSIIFVLFFLQSPATFAKQWTLVWNDEFDVSGMPQKELWNYEGGYIRNNEKQFYTVAEPKNSRIENGVLVLEAHKVSSSFWRKLFSDTHEYTSASLTTKNKAHWHYPRIEVRAKLPHGVGVWPAIWLLGVDTYKKGWPAKGEVDIMEFVGFDEKRIHSAIHTEDKNHLLNNAVNKSTSVESLLTDFHLYTVEINDDRIDFWINENLHFSYKKERNEYSSWPFDESMYLILNLAVGGGWGGEKGIDESVFPQKFLIDYVRVYQMSE
jgi:beta-glucanase (GH16 family)